MRFKRGFIFAAVLLFIFAGFYYANAKGWNSGAESHKEVVVKYGELKGLVKNYGKQVCIISNYKSRSRVDYTVEGKLKNKIAELSGKVITVEGKTERAGWSGTVWVKKIISIEDNNTKPIYHITIVGVADLQGAMAGSSKNGGVARIAAIIKKIKSENKGHTIVVFNGDDLMGRYFHAFKGRAIYSLLSEAGFEVYAFGNHEFDFGDKSLSDALKYARFDVLCSDLSVKNTPLAGKCKRYVIKNIGGIKIGIFSLMTENLAKISSPGNVKVKYSNRYAAKKMVRILKEHGADIVLALTHIGYKQDKKVASSVDGIDVIFGGHSHEYLKKANIINRTIIVNGGERGKYVVRLDIYLNKDKRILPNMIKYKLIAVSKNIEPDKTVELKLEKYEKQLPKSVVIGKIKGKIDLRESVLRFGESGFADSVNDILKRKFGVDVVFNNSGLFRGDSVYKNTDITDTMLHSIFEFNNTAYTLKLKGKYIKKVIEHSVKNYGTGGWLQVAGIRYVINAPLCKKLISENKKDITSCIKDIKIDAKPLEDDKIYTVLINDFLARGGNGYVWFEKYGTDKNNTYTTFYSIIEGYIKQNGGVFKPEKPDGRIKIIE